MITKFKLFEYNDLTGFEIGDRVEYIDYDRVDAWEPGVVTQVEDDGNSILVLFDNMWSDLLHDGEGLDGTSSSYWCSTDRLRMGRKRVRKFTAEDPYGEEDWEVNESAASIIKDPYYKICLTNARKCKSDSERYGAVLVKGGEILGEGYNRGIAHAKFKLDRILKQGYANHAEVEAMNDALAKGYNIDGADIYVAGYFPKTGTLFFKTQFTCKLCIPYFKKFNIQHIFVPLPDRWNPRTIDECIEDSQLFKKGQIHQDRLKYLIGDYKIGLLKENFEYDNLIKKIQSVLTKDLLKGMWNKEFDNPLAGHCYAATEALYWMLGGPSSDWKTYVLSHLSWPEGLDEGETHWFMRDSKGEILDPTAGQFEGQDIAYDKGRYNSMMNYPKGGSKRAREIMRRIGALNENVDESLEDFKVSSKIICKKTLKANFGDCFTRGKGYVITGYSIKDKKFFVASNNASALQFNLDEMREYFTNNPLPRVFNPNDPYGEEDWLGENVDNEIKVGDIVRVDKDFVIAGSTIFSRYNNYEVSGISKSGISIKGFPGWYSEWAFKKYEPVELDELDPYGEERWEDGPKYKNGDKINISHDKYAIIKEFDPYKREYTVDYYFKNSHRYLGYGLMDEDRLEKNGVNENVDELDPYGEEDWEEPKYKVGDKVEFGDKQLYAIIREVKPKYVERYENPFWPHQYHDDEFNVEDDEPEEPVEQEYVVTYHFKNNDKDMGWGERGESKITGLYGVNEKFSLSSRSGKVKKKIIQENHNMLNEAITPEKVKAAVGLIKQTIKGTEWEGKVFIAGGAVRDELMGNDPKDVDLLINVPDGGIKFADWITKELGIHTKGNPVIYPRFGTAKFSLRRQKFNGEDLSDIDIECVMPRKETYFEGDRKPDVSQGTLKDDVFRRDFSVNSLLKDLSTDEILDLTGMGKDDIKAGIVRTPLDPDVIFTDDPLRMLRAVRFATKYGWKLPLFMIRSLKRNAKKLQNISSERIREELDKMLLTKTPDKAIRLLQILGLSKYIFPELDKLIKMKQNKFHKYDAMRHTLEVLKNTPPDLVTRLSALLHDVGKSKAREIIDNEVHFYRHEELGAFMARDIMKRLRYPSDIIDAVATAVEHHMRTKQTGDEGVISDRSLRKMKQDLGPHLQHTLDVIHADNVSHSDDSNMPNQVSNIRRRFAELEEKDKTAPPKSPLSGDDVMDILGIKKGPIVGKILKVLGEMYLDDPFMSKEELAEIVKKSYEEFK